MVKEKNSPADSAPESISNAEAKCKCAGGEMKDGHCVLPEVTFSAFVMSLNTSALFHLGEIKNPLTGKKEKDLMLAKHTIDTLNVLKEKTNGNLTEEENHLLGNIIYDLHLRYVQAQ
ncbi:MAG: DUF1844 domain-containing protein [Thermodesulfobacteriota bacterium]|nr:DUF1844 domain-containing protein [Thermodesulfobacteriota bacterium]